MIQIGPYKLREHQDRMFHVSRKELGALIKSPEKPYLLMVAPTGSGKTIYSSAIMANRKPGTRIVFIVSGRQLVLQKSRKLSECELRHSIMMADIWSELEDRHEGLDEHEKYATEYSPFDPPEDHELIVISKDTLEAREISLADLNPDLIIVDEAHKSQSEKWIELLDIGIPVIGQTATPIDGKGNGLKMYKKMAVGASYSELVGMGHLMPCRIFAPFAVELKRDNGQKVKAPNGEYVQAHINEVYNKQGITGDAFNALNQCGYKGEPMLVFASSVEHSISIAEIYTAKGLKTEHVDANTSQKDRQRIFDAFESGETKAISNFDIVSTGTDFPCVQVIQLLTSVNSLSRFLQICGRASRPYENKEAGFVKDHFKIIDHGGNIVGVDGYEKHGRPTDDREWPDTEDGVVKAIDSETGEVKEPGETPVSVCPECKYEKGQQKKCPNCGYVYTKSGIEVRSPNAEFKEITRKALKKKSEKSDVASTWNQCLGIAASRNGTVGMALSIFKSKTGKSKPNSITPHPDIHEMQMRVRDLWPGYYRRKKASVK